MGIEIITKVSTSFSHTGLAERNQLQGLNTNVAQTLVERGVFTWKKLTKRQDTTFTPLEIDSLLKNPFSFVFQKKNK